MLCSVSCHKTKVVFHISVESNQFSFELVQHVKPVKFFIIGLAGFCSWEQKPIKIKKTNDSCTFSKPFLPQAVICIMVKNSSHKSHQIFLDTLSVYHLANVISDTNTITEYVSCFNRCKRCGGPRSDLPWPWTEITGKQSHALTAAKLSYQGRCGVTEV